MFPGEQIEHAHLIGDDCSVAFAIARGMPELATAFVAKDSRPPTTSDESIVAIANFDDTSLIRDEQDA